MVDFLTVEDINSIQFNNQGFWWHTIDFSKITTKTDDYSNVKYDFCTISRTKVSNGYKFFVKIDTSLWVGFNHSIPSSRFVSAPVKRNGGLEFTTDLNTPSIQLYLYLGVLDYIGLSQYEVLNPVMELNLKELMVEHIIGAKMIQTGNYAVFNRLLNTGYNLIKSGNVNVGYVFVKLLKTDFQFQCSQSLTIGKVNTVALGTLTDYKPNGDLIGDNTPIITVQYCKQTIPVEWNSQLNDYSFDIDLTEKNTTNKVKFKVIVESNNVINNTETEVVLKTQYPSVTNFNQLVNATGIVNLDANITFSSNMELKQNLKIIGNEHVLNLNGHSIILNEDISFNAKNIIFNNGDTAIIQSVNTKLELTDCSFNNCISSNYNDLGSCIFCDTNIESLEVEDDFETILTNCLFTNNTNCILHGGQLTVTNCKLHNTDISKMNSNNTAFLYQIDGNAEIIRSIFDIDYISNELCTNLKSIGFAQCLFMCGETGTINGATHEQLQSDNSLPFFNAPFNNRSHIFCKFYYPKLEICVFTSPLKGYEDKSACYAVSGVDWAFKSNAQVTRADAEKENTKRTIKWE